MAIGLLIIGFGVLLAAIIDISWEQPDIHSANHLVWPLQWKQFADDFGDVTYNGDELFDYHLDHVQDEVVL